LRNQLAQALCTSRLRLDLDHSGLWGDRRMRILERDILAPSTTSSAQSWGRLLGLGALAGAAVAALTVLADMVVAFVSAFPAVPFRADFAVYQLSTVALVAIALGGIAGALSGLFTALSLRLSRGRLEPVRFTLAVLLSSVAPGVISAASARLVVTHADGPENLTIGLVVGAIASGLFALLWRTEARWSGVGLRRWRGPLLASGVIGLAVGALLGLAYAVFTQFDLPSMALIYIFSPEFYDPTVPLGPTVLGDAALGASIGVIAAALGASLATLVGRFTGRDDLELVVFGAVLFVVVGGAGFVGARVDGLIAPSPSSVLSRDIGLIIPDGDKSVWPQAVLAGTEWGICAATIAIVLFVGFSQRRWISRWSLVPVGILGGATIAGLLGAALWAETSIWSSQVSAEDARAVLYPAPPGLSIALAIGALAGLLATMTADAVIRKAGRWATPWRSALVAMIVVALIGGIPLLHLAIYPDGESFSPDPLTVALNSGIVVLMVVAAGLIAGRWSQLTSRNDGVPF
jgi:hypothetical protein